MRVKVGIRRGVFGEKVLYDWLPKKEKKPQGIWWVKKVVGIIATFVEIVLLLFYTSNDILY